MSKDKPITGAELAIGGQAVLEGVMMRGREQYAVSVLGPDKKVHRLIEKIPKKTGFALKLRKAPFVRGMFALIDSLKIGYKALDFSADVAIDEEDKKEGKQTSKEPRKTDALFMVITVVASIGLAIGLFKFLPFFLSGFLVNEASSWFVWIEGLIKASVFIGYLLLISFSRQIRRVFEFHGAEHKAVHCYENFGLSKKLTAKHAAQFSRIHKRCGTTFLFLVIFVSIFIYAVIPIQLGFWLSFLIRLLFLPVIAGISFEILQLVPKLSDKNPLKWVLMVIELPGLLLQYISTREPDEEQLGVAIDALKHAVK